MILPYSKHLRYAAGVVALTAVITLPIVLVTGPRGSYESGKLKKNLISYLDTRYDLQVEPHQIILPHGVHSGLRLLEVFVLGHQKGKPTDLHFLHFILSSQAIPVHASPLFSISKTKVAGERGAVLDPSGRYLAYASMNKGKASAITILDLHGMTDQALDGFSTTQRLQQRMTNWQDTGLWRGLDRVQVSLSVPQAVELSWQRGTTAALEIKDRRRMWTAVIDAAGAKVIRGPATATRVRVGKRSFIHWAVDTVRNFSFVGPDKIAWLEEIVYGVVDKARRMSGEKVSAAEIKDEMDLPIISQAAHKIEGWPPPPLKPILRRPLKGEGKWVEVQGPFLRRRKGQPSYFAMTFVRSDRERLFSRVYFVAWDPRRLDLRLAGGTREPRPSPRTPGEGQIPRDPKILGRLVGAFNGGFQSIHGDFGMMVKGKVFSPPKPWAATVARLADGSTGFGTWDGKAKFGWIPEWIHSFRQNLTPLVEDGVYNPWRRGSWGGGAGFITGSGPKAHIVRSGLCLHKSGHVMFVLGNPVDGPILGRTMHKVGCAYGMELDINKGHVGFEFFNVLAKGEPDPPEAAAFKVRKYFARKGDYPGVKGLRYFMREIVHGSGNSPVPRWTGREARDFIYLLERQLLPRPDLGPMKGGAGGKWTAAHLPDEALDFPQALSRTYLQLDSQRRVHLVQLDLRWLDATLCVPSDQTSCLPSGGKRPLAIMPLGSFAGGRALLAEGKLLSGGQPRGGTVLNLTPRRAGGPALPALATAPSKGQGSISVYEAPQGDGSQGAHRAANALCVQEDGLLLYASGFNVSRAELSATLSHAGCNKIVHLGRSAPLALLRSKKRRADAQPYDSIYGDILPPQANGPSLLLSRSTASWAPRVFTHVKPQPRRVWTAVQPERTRASWLRHANRAAKALGLPPAKKVSAFCKEPYTDYPELKTWRWRDPNTGRRCSGKGKRRRRRTPK